jgi:hypothetical protein
MNITEEVHQDYALLPENWTTRYVRILKK